MDPIASDDVCEKHNGISDDDVSTKQQLLPKCVVPITPDSVRENGDFPIDLHSPLILVEGGTNNDYDGNDNDNDVDDAKSLSDEDIVELVYKCLLQVIVSMLIEEGVLAAAAAQILYDLDDSQIPPPSSPLLLLEEQLDTSPGAPMKVKPGSIKRNNIQLGLCKKLEF
ncbi:hypothetical protein RIF29_27107 [Crotalaria pallida]|uniref:Uncharacterized protein n=1 Tax=Crotalaria pallida TaxID=3830 RepID=A0AAN9EPF9_CROPI